MQPIKNPKESLKRGVSWSRAAATGNCHMVYGVLMSGNVMLFFCIMMLPTDGDRLTAETLNSTQAPEAPRSDRVS